MPKFFSAEASALLKGLLNRNKSARLGAGADGSERVRSCRFFARIDWARLYDRRVSPPYVPQVEGPDCCANFDAHITEQPALDSPASTPDEKSALFHGFTYEAPSPLAVAATRSPSRK